MGRLLLSVALILPSFAVVAQDTATVEQLIENLRAQLRDVVNKEAALQERKQKLEEDLKPENIEHSVSTIGTTDARALREQREQQLEREKATVESQLANLAESRNRLEASIANAEAEVVRLKANALGANSTSTQTATSSSTTAEQTGSRKSAGKRRTTKRVRRGKSRRPKRNSLTRQE
jgi:predicted  nucleic acid-binding Zn-ribbon protein